VNNSQVSDKLVTNMVSLAKKNQVPVLNVTETMPAKLTYQQWMLAQYRQLNQLLSD
jgi:zinc/manganese transport system substrate-binding protein